MADKFVISSDEDRGGNQIAKISFQPFEGFYNVEAYFARREGATTTIEERVVGPKTFSGPFSKKAAEGGIQLLRLFAKEMAYRAFVEDALNSLAANVRQSPWLL